MTIDRLTIRGVRNLKEIELTPSPGVNWLHGRNGAGKTSVLEAIHVLGRGRSFRSSQVASVIQHESNQLQVVVKRQDGITLGVERSRDDWRGRIGGRDSRRISEFAAALPLVLIEPDSHRLVDGGPDRRRQFLDWQLFHVEPEYLAAWQRYAKLLRQRNAGLKSGTRETVLDAIDGPMVDAASGINRLREQQVGFLHSRLADLLKELGLLLPGDISIRYRPGHPADQSLAESLKAQRDSDRERGFTQRGPHRAELVLRCDRHPAAAELSRGQQKLLALALLLTQLQILNEQGPRTPLLLLDDPVSELDRPHLEILLDWLVDQPFQTWITATEPGPDQFRLFHVEHGSIL